MLAYIPICVEYHSVMSIDFLFVNKLILLKHYQLSLHFLTAISSFVVEMYYQVSSLYSHCMQP